MAEWPSGELRLDGIDVTADPAEADLFVVPGNLRIFELPGQYGVLDHTKLYRLPYLRGNEARTVVFDVSDNFTRPINLPLLFIRCDVRVWMLPYDRNTIQMAWPVADFYEYLAPPLGGFKYDISFHGWISSDARREAFESCEAAVGLKRDFVGYPHFTGYLDTPGRPEYDPVEFARRSREFKRSMQESRIALCPESIPGVLPYRFFEAMSAGRVPLLVGRDYVLPFEDVIPYDDFTIRCYNPKEAGAMAQRLPSDEDLIERGQLARQYWTRYLNRDKWPSMMAWAVRKKLAAQTCV